MTRRAFLLVMDSVGIGGAPDAAAFGDEGANTIGHIARACAEGRADRGRKGPLHLPSLEAMGLGSAARAATGRLPDGMGEGHGIWAAARETGRGKDTPSGHWELAGAPVDFDWGQFPEGDPCFPPELINALISEAGLPGVLGQVRSNGMAIIDQHGAEHAETGAPILYGSADSVLQIAAHEESFGLERLYDVCTIARRLCDPLRIGRVIARPFTGAADSGFSRTPNRRDFGTPPHLPTLCDRVVAAGGRVTAVGKIGDIFAHRGISETLKGADDMALFDQMLGAMSRAEGGDLVFANFVEFDSNYGHMRDVAGYARALERFDARLSEACAQLRQGDLMIITADHGNDPTWRGSDHTREQVPVLITAPGEGARGLGVRCFADVGATVAKWLGVGAGDHGQSLL